MKENQEQKIERAQKVIAGLSQAYPDASCALTFTSAWELLVATMLSAQCTDKRVNLVTPRLFKRFPAMKVFAEARLGDIEDEIRSTGFYKNKAKNIQGAACQILEKHGGEVPQTMEELIALPGVGRKTANVLLGNFYEIPGLTVDTHMIRLNRRLGFSNSDDAVKVEFQLMEIIPKNNWVVYTHLIIHHGRNRCVARRPDCLNCEVRDLCPKIGVKDIKR